MIESKVQNMGETTSKVFSGEYSSETTRELYAETADFFASQIRNRLKNDRLYSILDIGAFQGELLSDLISKLSEYNFETTALDINTDALEENTSDHKLIAEAGNIPATDRSFDISIMRYVLQWNSPENQRQILNEVARTIKDFGIIEHAGADIHETNEWREKMSSLLSGHEIPVLRRNECFYASRDEIEQWMNESGIRFERIRDRIIKNGSNAFIERYGLDEQKSEKVRNILGNKDFFRQTDWIVYPKD